MVARNSLLTSPPYAVEQALKRLGVDLRTARLRRNLSVKEVAEKIGTGPRAVTDAEKGKASTSAGIYTALLWAFDMLGQLESVADPAGDEEGRILAASRERRHSRPATGINDDF